MLPRVTNKLGTISTLDDRPNDTSGLTAAELKAKFDADSEALKTYLNDTLLPYLESFAAAGQLGIKTIPGYSAATVQAMLEQIVTAMQDITQGSVADKSITLAKLAAEVTAVALGGAAASHNHGAGNITSGTLAAERIPVLDSTKLGAGSVGTSQLASSACTTQKIKDAAITAEKIAALAVLAQHIADGAVMTPKIAAKAVTAAKIADGTLTREKMAADVLGVPSEARNSLTPFDAYCNGRLLIVAPSEDKNFTLTADDVAALPDGFSVTIVKGQGVGAYKISWSGMDVLNLNDRRMMWNANGDGSGSISLKTVGDSVTITKWANLSRIIIQGNTHVRNIYDGTSATPPSDWRPGDIYLQYQ